MNERVEEFLSVFPEFEKCKFCEYFQPHIVSYCVMSCVKNGSNFYLGTCDKFKLCEEIADLAREL